MLVRSALDQCSSLRWPIYSINSVQSFYKNLPPLFRKSVTHPVSHSVILSISPL